MDRQRIIETNRSLRLIKNELESLLEKGIISDSAFDSISTLLPAESPLSGASAAARNTNSAPTPVATPSSTSTPAPSTVQLWPPPSASPAPSQSHNQPNPAPPSYAQSTASPPSLPQRNNPPAPAPAPEKPVLAHARALYRYVASDARDCSFDRDDRVAVHEYMNDDWWMGRNLRTGQEGIFPRSYVVVVEEEKGEKMPAGYQQSQYAGAAGSSASGGGGYPVAPVPVQYGQQPGQQQQGEEGGNSKMGEHGKKFGKKLGNAAIFGAGATIGSNIVNSIF